MQEPKRLKHSSRQPAQSPPGAFAKGAWCVVALCPLVYGDNSKKETDNLSSLRALPGHCATQTIVVVHSCGTVLAHTQPLALVTAPDPTDPIPQATTHDVQAETQKLLTIMSSWPVSKDDRLPAWKVQSVRRGWGGGGEKGRRWTTWEDGGSLLTMLIRRLCLDRRSD